MTRTGALGLGCISSVVALLAAGCGSTHQAVAAHPIEQAFVRLLTARHPGFRGPSRCPEQARRAEPQPCVAEMHKGDEYVQVWAYPLRGATVKFHGLATVSWRRKWSSYAPPPQRISPGLISVNAKGYDWRWLVLGADWLCLQKHRTGCTAPGIDGSFGGYRVFHYFRCRVVARVVSCVNSLGDGLRWRPSA